MSGRHGAEDEEDVARLDNHKRPVWLIKVPPRVARAWDAAREEDLLGKLRIHMKDGKADGISFHMDPASASTAEMTTPDFQFKISEGLSAPMRVFSKGDGGVEMQGVVEHSFMMQPYQSSEYNQVIASRVKTAGTRTRVVREMDNWDAMRFQQKSRVVKISTLPDGGLGDGGDTKRRRLDGDDGQSGSLREKIFQLFARKDEEGQRIQFWATRDLLRELKTTKGAVKDVLKELCIYHAQGDNARCYELKPEFKAK